MNSSVLAAFIAQHDGGEDRLDDDATAMLERQLRFVKAKTYDVKYPAFKARRFIPVSHDAPSGAETISYVQWDQVGMAKVIANYADDLPMVDAMAREFSATVKGLADAYQYSIQDLRRVAMSGMPLDSQRASAARRAIEAGLDDLAAFGLASANMLGFVNHPNVPVVAPITGAWASASAEEILADINTLLNSIVIATKDVHQPDTLLFGTAEFALVSTKPIGTDVNKTILKFLLDSSPYLRNVDQWHKLDTADSIGTGPRMVAYSRDPEVLELEIPQEFEQLPPQARNLAFIINCHLRMGGVSVRYPLAIAFMDGM